MSDHGLLPVITEPIDRKDIPMSSSLSASPLAVLRAPRKPPLLRVADNGDPAAWAAAHRDALRATLLEHGALLVRGLGLRDAAAVGAVFRGLAGSGLMAEREAFAPRQTYAEGVYSSTKWPANQQMCMHHELSYTLQFPGTMMFACLTAPTEGGATAVADSPTVLNSLPAAAGGPVREGRLDADPHVRRGDRGGLDRGVRHRRPAPRWSATAGPTASSSPGSPTAGCAPGSGAARSCGTR